MDMNQYETELNDKRSHYFSFLVLKCDLWPFFFQIFVNGFKNVFFFIEKLIFLTFSQFTEMKQSMRKY